MLDRGYEISYRPHWAANTPPLPRKIPENLPDLHRLEHAWSRRLASLPKHPRRRRLARRRRLNGGAEPDGRLDQPRRVAVPEQDSGVPNLIPHGDRSPPACKHDPQSAEVFRPHVRARTVRP